VGRERVERPVDRRVVGDVRRAGGKARQPRAPLPIVGEKAVDVGPEYPAIG
jgi:hypothetical protein